MLVSSNFRAISAVLLFAGLCACKPAVQTPNLDDLSYDELSKEIGKLKADTSSFEDLPGETRAEKLLYQAGIVAQMQTAMLVTFDTQAKTVRFSGNTKLADELEATRDIMMEAVELELSELIKDAGLLYENYLEPEEIERLIVLHSDPTMQKLIQNQPKMSQGMIPIGEKFGLRVGAKYEELVKKKAAK